MKKNSSRGAVLVVDEDQDRMHLWEDILREKGFSLLSAASAKEALPLADQQYFDLCFLRDNQKGDSTDDLLVRLVDMYPDSVVTVLSDDQSVGRAVRALRLGAFNFVRRPRQKEDLHGPLDEAIEYRRLRREGLRHRRELSRKYDVENIVGSSGPMQEVFRLVHKVARTDSTVLILGESGTGKELVARAIHHQSDRKDKPLVPVNCGPSPRSFWKASFSAMKKGPSPGP